MWAAYAKRFIQAIVDYAKRHPKECVGLSIAEYDSEVFEVAGDNNATDDFLNNFSNLEQGTYKWNGKEWVKQ